MKRSEAEKLINWMITESERLSFGVVNLSITRHNNSTKQIEKTISIKERPYNE